jgi:hypothetical protein
MLKLWSLSPSTLYYSTFRIRQTTLLTLIVNVFGGIIQPLNRCMQIIPHGISRFNYKASSYIEGRYSTVTKAENGMRLAVVGEPRLTKICRSPARHRQALVSACQWLQRCTLRQLEESLG